jgi:organic radical activating enzyme
MMVNKSEAELKIIANEWEKSYFEGEVYGFGLSEEMLCTTFFEREKGQVHNQYDEKWMDFKGKIREGHVIGKRLHYGMRVKAIFDNNKEIQNTFQNGFEILPPNHIVNMGKVKILVYSKVAYPFIKLQLEKMGLKEYQDFIYASFFVALYQHFVEKKVLLHLVTFCITTRCTLRCAQCNMFMPYYKNPQDMHLESLKEDMKCLFRKVDYVQEIETLGGEPLLYRNLADYLTEAQKYAHRVGVFCIDTNGTIIPGDDVIEASQKLDKVRFDFSYYPIETETYQQSFKAAVAKVKAHNISYRIKTFPWSQCRREDEIIGEEKLKEHCDRCDAPYVAFQSKKLYTCHLAWSAAQCGLGYDDPQDFLDFTSEDLTAMDIVKTGLGYLKRGYTSYCAKCNGNDPLFYQSIPRAEQV